MRRANAATSRHTIKTGGAHAAELIVGVGADRQRCEKELLARGVSVPLQHRIAGGAVDPSVKRWFLAVRDAGGQCVCGLALQVSKSRALPGHLLVRIERFGAALTDDARTAALTAVAEFARREQRVLRVYLDVFSRDADVRLRVAKEAEQLGFHRPVAPRSYTDTVVIELAADEAKMLASLGQRTRKNIREIAAHGLEARPITDVAYAPRMQALMRETMARTGGPPDTRDWADVIRFAAVNPNLGHVVGTTKAGDRSPDGLLAFSWARAHGDHVEIRDTASTRLPDIKASLTYVLVWKLMCWGASIGATWLDLGGVTSGTAGSSDPLGGISDFKRAFSKTIVTVGDEWIYEPHRMRAMLANFASTIWSRAERRRT